MTALNWILKILSLVPVIAAGVQQIHGEKDVATKTQLAQDSLSLAVQGATALLPAEQAGIASAVGTLASQTLATTVAALHASQTATASPLAA